MTVAWDRKEMIGLHRQGGLRRLRKTGDAALKLLNGLAGERGFKKKKLYLAMHTHMSTHEGYELFLL